MVGMLADNGHRRVFAAQLNIDTLRFSIHYDIAGSVSGAHAFIERRQQLDDRDDFG